MKYKIIIILLGILLTTGCKQSVKENTQNNSGVNIEKSEISIAAAANLRNVLEEIKQKFLEDHPDSKIRITYGSSGMLTQQIINGAPFDLFLAADTNFPEKIMAAGKSVGENVIYCYGRVVMWSTKLDVTQGLALVKDPRVKKIAIANPQLAPYGKSSVEALKKAGFYESIEHKIVWGENINQAAQFAVSANADIGFIALSIALGKELSDKGNYYVLSDQESEPIAQSGIVIKGKNESASQAFLDFITSPRTDEIWRKYGYEIISR